MSTRPPLIENISDTARWVATYRAIESERPDAIFRDPYARELAGARGEEIRGRIPGGRAFGWAIVVRTAVIDELVLKVVREGADTVVNLAAGLDTRPYRLELPSGLRWIEVDLPELIDHKESILQSEKPRCRLERERLDLASDSPRRALLARIATQGRKVAVITEGLLVYLNEDAVSSLAADLSSHESFRWWIMDVVGVEALARVRKMWARHLRDANLRMDFAPPEGLEFFRARGWEPAEFRSTWEESARLGRELRFAGLLRLLFRFAPGRRGRVERMSGLAVLERPRPFPRN